MATDTIFHRFWRDFDSILGGFLEPKSQKVVTKTALKNMTAKKLCKKKKGHAVTPPCPPLKEQSQDWQPANQPRD